MLPVCDDQLLKLVRVYKNYYLQKDPEAMKQISAFLLLTLVNFTVLAQNNNKDNIPLISVEGEGEVKVTPDEVTINFGVETRAATAQEASGETNRKVREVLKFLDQQGIASKYINTDFVRLDPKIDYQANRVVEYGATQSIGLLLKDIGDYEKIMSGLLERGINNIYSIEFGSSRIEEHKAEARVKAVKAAKEKARNMAEALGQSIAKAYFIEEVSSQAIPLFKARMASAEQYADSSGDPSIAPGQMSVMARVRVSFVLE